MEVSNLRVSNRKDKKYSADVIIDGILHRNVHFGSRNHTHFRDSTSIKAFAHLDHGDWNRKVLFHHRFKNKNGPAARLAKEFLW